MVRQNQANLVLLQMSLLFIRFYHQQRNHLMYRVLESEAPDFSCSQVLIAIDHHAKDYASILTFYIRFREPNYLRVFLQVQ